MSHDRSHQLLFTMAGFHLLVAFLPVAMLVYYFRPRAWLMLLTAFLGILIGYLNLLGTEPPFPVLLLLTSGFFLGAARTGQLAILTVLLGGWMPAGEWLRHVAAFGPVEALMRAWPASLALVAAGAGLLGGRWIARHARRSAENVSNWEIV